MMTVKDGTCFGLVSDVHLELGYEDCNHFHFIFGIDLFWQLVCIWTQNVSKLLKYELSVTGMDGMAVIYNILLTSQNKRLIGLKYEQKQKCHCELNF